jgi:glycyl-tRNA synthetase (class II)
MEDDTVTLRDRDTLEQVRVPIEGLVEELTARLEQPWRSPKVQSSQSNDNVGTGPR